MWHHRCHFYLNANFVEEMVILEAWSAGKPVIVTHNGGPAEFVWHNVTGLKTHADDGALAWGICELLRNREHGQWMAVTAVRRLKRPSPGIPWPRNGGSLSLHVVGEAGKRGPCR